MDKVYLLQTLTGHVGRVWSASWHPSGDTFASCGEDKTIRVWTKTDNNRWIAQTVLTDGHSRTIRDVAWSYCGHYLASASFDTTVAVWDKKSGEFECNATLEGHDNEVKSVTWSRSGSLLATCSRDKSVWIWEIHNAAGQEDEYECVAVLNGHTQDVKKVCWHPHEDLLASASYDNTIRLYRQDTVDNEWEMLEPMESHTSTVWSISFDATGKRLASCSEDTTVKIWQQYGPDNTLGIPCPDKGSVWKCVCTLSGFHTRSVYDIDWCKQTGLLATACGDDLIRIFKESTDSDPNQPTFELVVTIAAHSQDANKVAWHPVKPGILLTASDDGEIKIWHYQEEDGPVGERCQD
ncbi:probable cytosolic iron-sulfur protein assembly protein Ciao1 [Anopheles marshallii]|uniref:probable cytosolic iron-sulfur protein assembly protein Ciao1 n=1 Tax=Anopheles marshallii TaxID=1521116 RepID=UPI00237A6B13|nr:probable cytosolic iron-sulfur protein assembly protein Ciao1 [Anopheles marshallii]